MKGQHTSFNCLTFPIIPSTCPSFWLSNSFKTASLYCPLLIPLASSPFQYRNYQLPPPQLTSNSASQAYIPAPEPQVLRLTHSQLRHTRIPQHNCPVDLGSRTQVSSRSSRRCSSRREHYVDRVDEGMSPRIYFSKNIISALSRYTRW
jgi:hypothetical protein